ncbi:ricin-type beta-trefoil lectin domain protein, partial [Bacillus cereus]|nr:ricin-type beta-trefoil lectin domain protein [Bacillus cereus]
VGSNQALSINDASQISIQPLNSTDTTQHWNIQKVKKNTFMIESVRYPLYCMDVEKAWTAPLPGANVILYKQNGNANQQWKIGAPITIEVPTDQEIKQAFKVHSYNDQVVTVPGSGHVRFRHGVYFEFPIAQQILESIASYEVLQVSKAGSETRKSIELTTRDGYYYLPIGVQTDYHRSYQLIATLLNGKEVIILTGWSSSRNTDSKGVEKHLEHINIQFNFYNSTCNVYYHDDHHVKKQNNE